MLAGLNHNIRVDETSETVRWYRLAAEQGLVSAMRFLASSQIAEAQRLARAWDAAHPWELHYTLCQPA